MMPAKNEPDLYEIPERIRRRIRFHFVSEISELEPFVLAPQKGSPRARRRDPAAPKAQKKRKANAKPRPASRRASGRRASEA
jgi:hypothetical protein